MLWHPLYQLGGYREYPPPADLKEIIATVWIYSRPANAAWSIPAPGHRVLPESGVSLCFQCLRAADGAVTDPRLLFMGPIHSIRFFDPPPAFHFEAVRLRPEWCRALLRIDPAEQTNGVNDLGTVAPDLALPLFGRLAQTKSTGDAIAHLIAFVRAMRDRFRPSRAAELAHQILQVVRCGQEPLSAVALGMRISERHLRRVVADATGLRPKYLQRVARLNRVVAAADGHPSPNWAALAADGGFFDQPHMINEFLTLTGRSPTQLHLERRSQIDAPQ